MYSTSKDLYYDPSGETAFGSHGKLLREAKNLPEVKPSDVKPWLGQQRVYFTQTCLKVLSKEPLYLMDVWECGLVNVRLSLSIMTSITVKRFLWQKPLNSN